MPRRSTPRPTVPADALELRSDDEVVSLATLAARLGTCKRTITRSGCPFLRYPQREGARGARTHRRYVVRVAQLFFSAYFAHAWRAA